MKETFLTSGEFSIAEHFHLSDDNILVLYDCQPCSEIQYAIEMFLAPRTRLKAAMEALTPIRALAVLIKQIPSAIRRYEQANIPLQILWDGLEDIGIWCREHTRRTNTPDHVFGMLLDDPNGYPESTSLQRSMKAYLSKGNHVVMGKGIYVHTSDAQ